MYIANSMCSNPAKPHVTVFHLKNKEEKLLLKLVWNDI